jgi:hypothetical protein
MIFEATIIGIERVRFAVVGAYREKHAGLSQFTPKGGHQARKRLQTFIELLRLHRHPFPVIANCRIQSRDRLRMACVGSIVLSKRGIVRIQTASEIRQPGSLFEPPYQITDERQSAQPRRNARDGKPGNLHTPRAPFGGAANRREHVELRQLTIAQGCEPGWQFGRDGRSRKQALVGRTNEVFAIEAQQILE